MLSRRNAIAAGVASALALAGPAMAQVGVTEDSIKIGNTMPYSGPASAYGQIGETIEKYFDKLNDEGGVNGRTIDFITYDDGYSPPKTVEQVRRLVEQDQVAALFSVLGTPTNSAIHRYVNAKGVPHLFLATGASKWGDPENYPWTMGWQPNYPTEGAIYAKYILDNVEDPKIGVLVQNDDYGKDYLSGFVEGLGDKADELIVAEESYEVADPTVDSQIINLKASGANVFFNITTPKFAAQAIKKAHDIGWKPTHFLNNVSQSVGAVMKPAGLEASQGVISAIYQKEPGDPQWEDDPAMQEWHAFMDEYYPDGDKSSSFTVFGYNIAKTMEQVLRQAGDDLSRENIMKQAANLDNLELPLLLPGIVVDTSATDFYPIEAVQLVRFEDESWVPFGEVLSSESE
ncbi:MAG: ABC transporter substrate-binding protein [Pseudomonadota bacterium]